MTNEEFDEVGFSENVERLVREREATERRRGPPSKQLRVVNGKDQLVHDWDAPDESILDDRRGELPNFPTDTMPGKEIIALCAHGAGVSFDHVAVPLLAIASAVIGTARRVRASRSFTQPAALWAAIVGLSGTGKTPGINVAKRALVEVERTRRAAIDEKRRSHEARREAAKLARKQWEAKLKETAEEKVVSLNQFRDTKAAEPMPIEAEDPGPFIVPRLFVTDSTIERLAQLITARPSGALMIVDELAALFLNMSRYTGGSDREFWLQAWCGDPYRVERMGRDPVDLDHLLVGVIGGLQPDKLSRSFQGDHDGIYARILFAWPPEPRYRPLSDEVGEIEPEVFNAFKRLVELEAGQSEDGDFAPRAIPLTDGARRLFEDFRHFLHFLQKGLDGRERDWVAKMPAHVLRLALTLCLLDYGFRGGPEFDDGRRGVHERGHHPDEGLFLPARPRRPQTDRIIGTPCRSAAGAALDSGKPPRRNRPHGYSPRRSRPKPG